MLLQTGFDYLNKNAGNILRVRYFTESIGSVYDDDRTLTVSGNDLYTSGILLSIDSTKGSADQVLLEQGRISYDDSKIYVGSAILTTSGTRIFTIQPSGTSKVYEEIVPGMMQPEYFGEQLYKKIYVRLSNNGSLF